jgi:ribonucleoside-diphosphate reductase alpha chain
MRVLKRSGNEEAVSFNKVLQRIRKASKGLTINPDVLAQQVLSQIYDGVKTSEIDELTAQLAASLSTNHPDWATLASNIVISNHQKKTSDRFSSVMLDLSTQPKGSYIHEDIVALCTDPVSAARIDAAIDYQRDYQFDYFGFKTLEKSYLLRDAKRVIKERPQHMWMRVALALWTTNLDRAFETYDALSLKKFTHATPTLFNSGTPRQQLSSCFLLTMKDDSIAGIYETLKDCATISQHAGGIGLSIHKIRAKGSIIRGTNGTSNGIVPMLRNFNATARYVDQCFTPDTLVYTQTGPKEIEQIGVTDKVLTSRGTYENVRLPVRHSYTGPMLELQIKNSIYPVRTTPDHQILALTSQDIGLNYSVIRNRLEKKYATIEFYDAKDLRIGDFIAFPIPTYELDNRHITEDDCRMYGILLGDGYISRSNSGVCLNSLTKINAQNFTKQYMSRRGIHVTESFDEESPNTVKLSWSSNHTGFKFTYSQLYDETSMKRFDSAFLHLPKPKILQVLHGILETDGCIGEKEISLELTSHSIIEAVRYMLLRLGGLSSGYTRNRIGSVSSYKGITTRLETAVLRIPRIPEILALFPHAPESRCFSFLRHENMLLSRIEDISETEYSGIVHDFEIEAPHDYVVSHLGVAHNGGGKRNGSFAIYLEPWHADIEDFLKLKLNTGMEEDRARDLFYALWIPDLFMKRVEANVDWTVFCPDEAPGLDDVWGAEFEALYHKYEAEGRGRKKINAQKLWFQILDSQIETGTPYLLYKDAANAKSNQQNLGTIKSSNLCTEIIEYSSPDETAVCNLASISLPSCVTSNAFDFEELRKIVAIAVRNLNRVIDINYYPTPETKKSNMRHRPVGLGIQGLADVFAMLKYDWESPEAARLNQLIFEYMYFEAVSESARIAQVEGSYVTFPGSPASQGRLQPDMWNVTPLTEKEGTLDWATLRTHAQAGLRNSLLVAPMPTASTSQILGNNECFEPFTTNIYTRRTLAGEFTVLNKYLLSELRDAGLWSDSLKNEIIARNGSVQGIEAIPVDVQARYKTTWEIKQRTLIDMARDRGAFIDQSQSLNLFVADPTYSKLTSMHFYAWKAGLKTGCYYLRSKAPVVAQQFTVDPRLLSAISSGGKVADLSSDSEQDDSDEETPAATPAATPLAAPLTKAEERRLLLERLSAEYEAEQAKGCTMCSS